MKKILIVGTIILTTALLVSGVYFPDYPLMWMAATSTSYELVRILLISVLAILLFSHPPRAMYFRYFLAALAMVLSVATVAMLATYEMNLIDAIVFLETAIIFGIEALETETSEEKNGTAIKVNVKHGKALAK